MMEKDGHAGGPMSDGGMNESGTVTPADTAGEVLGVEAGVGAG
jgi:hypothetical protein